VTPAPPRLEFVIEGEVVHLLTRYGTVHATMALSAFHQMRRDVEAKIASGEVGPQTFVRVESYRKPKVVQVAKDTSRQRRKREKAARRKNR
jgi:hypothetical protein